MSPGRATEVQPPLHRHVERALHRLRDDLGQQVGLGEVLRAHDDAVAPRAAAQQRAERDERHDPPPYRHASLRSTNPSTASAPRARSAARSAPAMMSVSSTVATPRKMSTPSPPAPIAPPKVATPPL